MKKIVTLGATTLTALTLLGAAQPLAHAAHLNGASVHADQVKADTTAVSIPDANLKNAIKTALGIKIDPTVEDMQKLKSLSDDTGLVGNYKCDMTNVSSLKGLGNATNLERLYASKGSKVSELPDFSKLKVLNTINLVNADLTDVSPVQKLPNKGLIKWVNLSGNHITDLSYLKEVLTPEVAGKTLRHFSNQTVTEAPQTAVNGNLVLKVKAIKNVDGTTPTITPSNGGVYDATKGEITWTHLDTSLTNLSYSWQGATNDFSGKVTVPVTVTDKQPDTKGDVTVEYNATVTPSEPTWYSIIPSGITFTDKAKEVDASVKLADDLEGKTPYDGTKTISVNLTSPNAYNLKEGAKDTVAYSVLKGDGTALQATNKEQELGTLKGVQTGAKAAEIDSKAKLTGSAKESGKFTDTLTYRFSEK